ncbi:hypothetical protein ACFQV2_23215 [Actinokineospora soli]|uniref:Uncharacterized protein n=1 Tax=Actinokineospora soli TaxID=1048753 RepID=A0ABW2TQ72_9PSEU
MTASREPEPLPADDAPTVHLRLVGNLPTPAPARRRAWPAASPARSSARTC